MKTTVLTRKLLGISPLSDQSYDPFSPPPTSPPPAPLGHASNFARQSPWTRHPAFQKAQHLYRQGSRRLNPSLHFVPSALKEEIDALLGSNHKRRHLVTSVEVNNLYDEAIKLEDTIRGGAQTATNYVGYMQSGTTAIGVEELTQEKESTLWPEGFIDAMDTPLAAMRRSGLFYYGGTVFFEETKRGLDLGRFYLNTKAEAAAPLFAELTKIYKRASAWDMIMQFKLPVFEEMYSRRDTGVVYFDAKSQEWFYDVISQLAIKHSDWFEEATPFFAAKVCRDGVSIKGLSFAMNPAYGSYGEAISHSIAVACRMLLIEIAAGKNVTRTDLYRTVAYELYTNNIDVKNTAFLRKTPSGVSGVKKFAYIHARTA